MTLPPDSEFEGPVQDPLVDINSWFRSRGIPVREARSMVHKVQQNYPHLSKLLKGNRSVMPELELIQLVFDSRTGRFPPTK